MNKKKISSASSKKLASRPKKITAKSSNSKPKPISKNSTKNPAGKKTSTNQSQTSQPKAKKTPNSNNKTTAKPRNKSSPKPQSNKNSSISRKFNVDSAMKVAESVQNLSQKIQNDDLKVNDIKQLSKSIDPLIPNSSTWQQSKKIVDKSLNLLQLIQGENTKVNSSQKVDDYRSNYITNNRFYVEIDRNVQAAFKEFSGINVKIKKDNYFEGGVNDQVRVLLGHADFSDVTLKRGMTNDLTFLNWIIETLKDKANNRRNINILLFNQAGETMQGYTLIGAIPISWKVPGFQADGNAVAIEELTLAYEGLSFIPKATGSRPTINLKRDIQGFFPSK
ncbi:phage tail protein [[Phormidium ambiguum] IAM M-71]|uniref:phage tail protein n=1 Tax=[Phormidium ambiguum] IAM M-71 TaxID=454136 RepID=UPI001F00CFDB|nr:phage tail protein [Phormidium ambiguum]